MSNIVSDILHVDLTERKIWREHVTKERILKYLGGRGISAEILWKSVKPGTDPLGPENVIILGPGLLTGTPSPSSGRTTVTCMSPATNLYLKTNGGGQWGGELRYAGYSHIVVHGKADRPVYIWIDDDQVEIRDASKYWGMDVRTLDINLKKDIGDEEIQIASIGKAGENLVKFAAVMFSIYNAAGRGGAGAVMGSKNLKAIAVRGNGYISTANPKLYHQRVEEAKTSLKSDSGYEGMGLYGTSGSLYGINELKVFPSYNFQRSSVENIEPFTGQNFTNEGHLKRRVGCFSCIISCHRFGTVDSGPFAGSYSGGPEYETMSACGSGLGIFDTKAVMKINELMNLYGMDVISGGGVIQWAMECYEKGVIGKEELDGLDLKWGNSQAAVEMVRKIANREGFGDVLAEGVKIASEKVGGESYKWAVQAKGLEQSRVDTRSAKSYALAFAVNPRGADHLHTETFAEFGMGPEARELIKKITGDENLATPYVTEKRAEIVRWHEDCYAVTDCLGFCSFTTTALYGITPRIMADLFSAALGVNVSEEEIMESGRRIVTLEKCFNVRLGATRKDDTLPYRMMHDPTPDRPDAKDAVNTQEELDMLLDEYYTLHGWDKETSRPTKKNLVMLGLDSVADELISMNMIGQERD